MFKYNRIFFFTIIFTIICKISIEMNDQYVKRPLETMNYIFNFIVVTFEEISVLILLLPDGCMSDYSCIEGLQWSALEVTGLGVGQGEQRSYWILYTCVKLHLRLLKKYLWFFFPNSSHICTKCKSSINLVSCGKLKLISVTDLLNSSNVPAITFLEKNLSRIYCLQITICDHQVCSIGPVGTIYN